MSLQPLIHVSPPHPLTLLLSSPLSSTAQHRAAHHHLSICLSLYSSVCPPGDLKWSLNNRAAAPPVGPIRALQGSGAIRSEGQLSESQRGVTFIVDLKLFEQLRVPGER